MNLTSVLPGPLSASVCPTLLPRPPGHDLRGQCLAGCHLDTPSPAWPWVSEAPPPSLSPPLLLSLPPSLWLPHPAFIYKIPEGRKCLFHMWHHFSTRDSSPQVVEALLWVASHCIALWVQPAPSNLFRSKRDRTHRPLSISTPRRTT